MKFLGLIFSFYVMLLSVKPCCADRECPEKTVTKKELTGKTSSKEKKCQGCSPFFSCGSCTGFIIAKSVTHNLVSITEKTDKFYAPYNQPDLKEIALAIWQPPRLS